MKWGVREPFVLKGLRQKKKKYRRLKMKIVKHTGSKFTVVPNKLIFNNALSMKEKGILAVMFGLPDDWKFSIRGLATLNNDGVEATASALKSLERQGYLKREQLFDENGRFSGVAYHIYGESQNVDNSLFGPRTGNDNTENCQLLNTNISSTNKLNTIRKESRPLKKCYDNFKNKIDEFRKKVRSQKQQRIEENEQLKEESQVSCKTQAKQDLESVDVSNQQLMEAYQNCAQPLNCQKVEGHKTLEFENTKSEETHTYQAPARRIKKAIKKFLGLTKKPDPPYKDRPENYSADTYGRESFDQIVDQKIKNIEERNEFKKYMAFKIKKSGGAFTNQMLHDLLKKLDSISESAEERIDAIKHSLKNGYNSIYPAPETKKEYKLSQYYAAISMFE